MYRNIIFVVEGDNLTLDCRAVGCPIPSIAWQSKDTTTNKFSKTDRGTDVKIEPQERNSTSFGSKLTITNTSRSRAGIYRCRSNNDAVPQKKGSSQAEVIVYCKKIISAPWFNVE